MEFPMKYLTLKELRRKLGGRGRTTIYRDIDAKRLPPPIKLGGINYFPEDAIDDALRKLSPASNDEV
jgi:prophage regulatory protein